MRLILWPLTAHATKDRVACKHFHRLSALRARFQKRSPDELFPHKTCFELWHWDSHHSKLFTDPTKVWSTFEPVMICASKVCWFCPDVARWARPSFTKNPAHTPARTSSHTGLVLVVFRKATLVLIKHTKLYPWRVRPCVFKKAMGFFRSNESGISNGF